MTNKSRLGNDSASKENIERSLRDLKLVNFEPVYLPAGALLCLTKIIRALPAKQKAGAACP